MTAAGAPMRRAGLRVGKGGRLHSGRVAAFTSESLAGFARNTHLGGRAGAWVLASAACVLRTR
jgi:hypothetical protein